MSNNLIHSIGLFFHNFFHANGKKVTADDIKNIAEDAAKVANVYVEVKNDVKGITDPALLAKAVAASVVKHSPELPTAFHGTALEAELTKICIEVTKLPLETIETVVKAELAVLHK